jgi:glycosyltransferase involved in cell wall biosynthesis
MFSFHVDSGRDWRGGQSQVMYTVTGLRALGHRAALAADPDGELYRRMSEGLDLVPLPAGDGVDLASAWRLSRVIKRMRPDVVHAHDPHALAISATALAIAQPSPRPPLVAARRDESRFVHNSLSRWQLSQVDCFIANCKAINDRVVADGVARSKIVVVHEGVDVERVAKTAPADVHGLFYMPHGCPVIGCVAPLVPGKGLHHLVDATELVLKDVPDVRAVIVGDGELRESLERHIRERHLERHVLLAGFRWDAIEMTRGFDLFAMSSVSEGMCTALVDAMAAGQAAVATNVGGIPEVMADGDTGFLVPPRDHAAMAAKLVLLLKDAGMRHRMGQAAQRRAQALFSVDRMVRETAAVYARVAGTHREGDTASPLAHG